MNTAPIHGSDPHWLLGLAQVRAQQIIRWLNLYEDGELGADSMAEAIREEAQAILDQTDPTPTEDDAA
jgi:hypothetical protein